MNDNSKNPVVVNGDEDMKVVGHRPDPEAVAEDAAEEEARRFLLQKSSGNIEKARTAGLSFANAIIGLDFSNDLGLGREDSMLETHHRLLLCSYIVNRVIAERSPDNLLAQTSLGAFYSEIEARSPHLYQHVSDMAAFSLYILSDRSNRDDDCSCNGEIGKIYARLCGFDGAQEKIDEGNNICVRFYSLCSGIIESAGYKEV